MKMQTVMSIFIVLIIVALGSVIFTATSGANTVEKQMQLGIKYLSESKYEEAILAFEKAIKIDSRNVEVRMVLSKAYVATNQLVKAESLLIDTLNIADKKAEIYLELADIYIKQGKSEEAIKLLEKGYNLTKDNEIKEKLAEIVDAYQSATDSPTPSPTPETGATSLLTATPTPVNNDPQKQDIQNDNSGIGGYPNVESGVFVSACSEDTIKRIRELDPIFYAGVDVSINKEKLPQWILKDIKGAIVLEVIEDENRAVSDVTIKAIERDIEYRVSINYDFSDYSNTITLQYRQGEEGVFTVGVVFLGENNKIIGIYYNDKPLIFTEDTTTPTELPQ